MQGGGQPLLATTIAMPRCRVTCASLVIAPRHASVKQKRHQAAVDRAALEWRTTQDGHAMRKARHASAIIHI